MTARSSRLVALLLATALVFAGALPAYAGTRWSTGYGAEPGSFKQGDGRHSSISVTPTTDSLALVTIRDRQGTVATLAYGWIKAGRRATWDWYGENSAGTQAPTGTYTYWVRLTRGRTSHWYKGEVFKYATKIAVPISDPPYQWGTGGVRSVPLRAVPAYFSIALKAPFFDPETGQPQTVHDSVWLTNGNDVPLADAPFYLGDHVAMSTGGADVTSSASRRIPSPGNYRLHWIVENPAAVTIRQ